jgi:hypothetical protein
MSWFVETAKLVPLHRGQVQIKSESRNKVNGRTFAESTPRKVTVCARTGAPVDAPGETAMTVAKKAATAA